MKYQMGVSLLALVVSAGCTAGDVTGSLSPDREARLRAPVSSANQSSPRSGDLIIRKDCHLYAGQAGDICTITESSLEAIEVGSTITYASSVVSGFLDTDIILDLPGPGNNAAFGHCSLSLATGVGECRLSGGTGKFTQLHARVAVSPLGGSDFAWNGTYGYGR
jgi:hypothetical protein